jgi:hypothetical protein
VKRETDQPENAGKNITAKNIKKLPHLKSARKEKLVSRRTQKNITAKNTKNPLSPKDSVKRESGQPENAEKYNC